MNARHEHAAAFHHVDVAIPVALLRDAYEAARSHGTTDLDSYLLILLRKDLRRHRTRLGWSTTLDALLDDDSDPRLS